MGKKLRVGNLGFEVDAGKLKEVFAEVGKVTSTRIAESQYSGKSLGFGFVDMSNDQEAAECITRFHGVEREGRKWNVTEDASKAKRVRKATK